jgi:hypothetical protein
LTDHGQRSTALLIEPQTFFSLVSGKKADNQIKILLAQTDELAAKKVKGSQNPKKKSSKFDLEDFMS